jgi:hypothetical protein
LQITRVVQYILDTYKTLQRYHRLDIRAILTQLQTETMRTDRKPDTGDRAVDMQTS